LGGCILENAVTNSLVVSFNVFSKGDPELIKYKEVDSSNDHVKALTEYLPDLKEKMDKSDKKTLQVRDIISGTRRINKALADLIKC